MKAKRRSASVVRWRFYFALIALCTLLLALVWHLASLQVLPHAQRGFEFLQRQGMDRTLRKESIAALRGVITDRNGEPLAVSTPVVSLWADPQALLEAEEAWPALVKALDIQQKVLKQKLERYKAKEFMYLRRHLTPDVAARILDLAL